MSETTEQLAAERDRLAAENEQLRAQLEHAEGYARELQDGGLSADERDRLIAENEQLRGQLAAAGATGRREFQAQARRPFLSEGERQELALYGETNSPFTGERLTTEQVRAELAESDTQREVEIPDPVVPRQAPARKDRTPIGGVDYVYPSVAPGRLAQDR